MQSEKLQEGLKKLLLDILRTDTNMEPSRFSNHREAIVPWIQSLASGTFSGRPFSHHTVGFYSQYVEDFLRRFDAVSFPALEQALAEIPVEQFSKKNKYFQAIICFAKYLIRENSLPESFLEKAKRIKPKRHIPPKQTCVNAEQLKALLKACRTPYETLMIVMLSETGLRAHEFCSLKRKDLNLEEGYLTVTQAKWGKRRKVGMNPELVALLRSHLEAYQVKEPEEEVFLDARWEPLSRGSLLQRLSKIGKRAGVHVHPHALRRTFVTLNANNGRPLQMLQMACGHASITTTLSYCKTSEDEMIAAMRGWSSFIQ